MKSLASSGLSDVKLTGADETSVDHAISSFNKLSTEMQSKMAAISTHTYSASNREVRGRVGECNRWPSGAWNMAYWNVGEKKIYSPWYKTSRQFENIISFSRCL